MLGVVIYSNSKLESPTELSDINTTGIMWIGLISSAYVTGNAVSGFTNNKNGKKREDTNIPSYSTEP